MWANGPRITRRAAVAVAMIAFVGGPLVSSAEAQTELPPPTGAAQSADIENRRTSHSQTWRARDGGLVTKVSSDPLFWRDANGSWRSYNLGLRRSAAQTLNADLGPGTAEFPSRDQRDLVVAASDHELRLTLLGGKTDVAGASLREAVYTEALPGVTRKLRTAAAGVKEDLVIASQQAPRRFEFALRLSGNLEPSVTEFGDVVVRDKAGVVFRIPRGVAYEQARPNQVELADRYELTKDRDSVWRLSIGVNERWASDSSRQWPVVLDPSVDIETATPDLSRECQITGAHKNGRTGETTMCQGAPQLTAEQYSDAGVARVKEAALRFTLPGGSSTSGGIVTKAALQLHPTATSGTTPGNAARALRVSRMTGPTLVTAGSNKHPHAVVADDVRPVTAGTPVTLDVTGTVRGWGEGRYPNNGLAVTTVPGQLDGLPPAGSPSQPHPYHYRVDIATSTHPDLSKRPVLTVWTGQRAQSGSEVSLPVEGKLTSRFVPLEARAGSANVKSVKFEYLAPRAQDWQDVPRAALQYQDDNVAPTSTDIPVLSGNRRNRVLIWDLQRTPGVEHDGQVQVRAVLDDEDTAGGGYTAVRSFRLDRQNSATSTTSAAGPGAVDLLTGDLSVTETDAEVEAALNKLQFTRTYHSRGTAPRNSEMFGPGWTAGVEPDGAKMPYKSIYNFTKVEEREELDRWSISETDAFWNSFDYDAEKRAVTYNLDLLNVHFHFKTVKYDVQYSMLELADGSKLSFRKVDGVWRVDERTNLDIQLEDHTAGGMLVRDTSGTAIFTPRSSGSPHFDVSSYTPRGSTRSVLYEYEPFQGRSRLKRIVAPRQNGQPCVSTAWAPGCRALELQWNDSVPAGASTVSRVTSLLFRSYGVGGGGTGELRTMALYFYDTKGRLREVQNGRSSTGLPKRYQYDSEGRLQQYEPPGEKPWTFRYQTVTGDSGSGRLQSVTRKTPSGQDATTTYVFDIPTRGFDAPHNMARTELSRWGQTDVPLTGVAVFPPDAVPVILPSGNGMPTSWNRATFHYLGEHGKTTNVVDPAGNIATAEHDENSNLIRQLTPRNRERALAATGSTAARAQLLSTVHVYAGNGKDLFRTLGPEQEFRRPDGSTVLGRQRTVRYWDGGKPALPGLEGDQHLLTEESVGIRRSDGVILDEKTTRYDYFIDGWKFGKPVRVIRGTGDDAATTHYEYDFFGRLTSKTMPKRPSPTQNSSYVTAYHYFQPVTAGSGHCGEITDQAKALEGQLCKIRSVDTDSGLKRVDKLLSYDAMWQLTGIAEYGSIPLGQSGPDILLRQTTVGRDILGRETFRGVASVVGAPIPNKTTGYSASTGRLTVVQDSQGSTSRAWDDNGRLAEYTDALGTKTAYTYDIAGRATSEAQSTGTSFYGTRGFVYDSRDEVISVVDSGLPGPINATRDADGNVVKQVLPGNIEMTRSFNHMGAPVSQQWVRTTGCTGSACTLVDSSVERDGQQRVVRQQSTESVQEYDYDSLGRLTREDDLRSGVCSRQAYSYDKNSNRTARSKSTSASGEACGSGSSSTVNSTHDVNDRVVAANGASYVYDSLGRTLSVPAVDSPEGAGTTSLAYDADDLVNSIQNSDTSQSITRDPMRRLSRITTTGSSSAFGALRYGSDEDAPSGRNGATWWERYVGDTEGRQLAIVSDTGSATWQLSDVQGNVVASLPVGGSTPEGRSEYSAFGSRGWISGSWTSRGHNATTHAWLGSLGKETAGGRGSFVHMGARVYNPVSGRFLQVDPVTGGSANDYDYCNQDPINCLDLDGRLPFDLVVTTSRFGVQLDRGASMWLLKGYVSLAPGALALKVCRVLTMASGGAWGCGGVASAIAGTITDTIANMILKKGRCLEFGQELNFPKPWELFKKRPAWSAYAKSIDCRSV